MIEEMFIPVLVFDRVISVMESKREFSWFQRFKGITTCDAKFIQYADTPHMRLSFSAIADSAIEVRTEGSAASPVTVRTVAMTFILDPNTKLVKQLKLDQIEKSAGKEIRIEKKFVFDYIKISGKEFPSQLVIEKDGKEEIRFKAEYQQQKGFVIFKNKEFRYVGGDGDKETVNISYGKYAFNKDADLSVWESGVKGKDALTREADAEKLFQKAREEILNGDASKAKSLLKKIIKDYPQTTVAEQASTLLNGLP
jgi:TolA-binding protein